MFKNLEPRESNSPERFSFCGPNIPWSLFCGVAATNSPIPNLFPNWFREMALQRRAPRTTESSPQSGRSSIGLCVKGFACEVSPIGIHAARLPQALSLSIYLVDGPGWPARCPSMLADNHMAIGCIWIRWTHTLNNKERKFKSLV